MRAGGEGGGTKEITRKTGNDGMAKKTKKKKDGDDDKKQQQ